MFIKKDKKSLFSISISKTFQWLKKNASDIKVLEKVYGALATSGLEKDTKRLVEGLIESLFLNSLEETNARQSMARREGIGGYDENMLRSFVTNAKSQANLIANLAYGKEINVALSKAYKESIEHPNDRTTKLYKELVFHYNLMLSQKETAVQDSIASFTTAWVLTMNPSYHLQNMTQPWAVSYPLLAATFNDWQGVAPRLTEGYAIARSIISYDGKVPFLAMKKVTWQTNVDIVAIIIFGLVLITMAIWITKLRQASGQKITSFSFGNIFFMGSGVESKFIDDYIIYESLT